MDENIIRRNKRLFENYCWRRRQSAYDLNSEKASVAFEIIPVLLSLNDVDLPGYVKDGEEACGLYGVGTSKKLNQIVQNYFSDTCSKRIPYQRYLIQHPIIESLFIMGSTGTVAQKSTSDFDFWVCVDTSRFSAASIEKLRAKTEKISRWCQNAFDMEAHFFIMTAEQIRNNDFGTVGEDQAGSSQKKFLKEEFYRTLLLISGKIPFWWVIPPGTKRNTYEELWHWWQIKDLYDRDDYVNLGYLEDVPREEFLGTTLWHLSKGIKDPFKALIKMTMMEWYLSDSFNGRLLCDVLKDRVLGKSRPLMDLDPYCLMVQTVLDFYHKEERWDHIELLKKAFYIKANPNITRLKLKTKLGDYQVGVFNKLMNDWNWSLDKAEDLNQMPNWSYARHLTLAQEVQQFFFSTYKRLRKTFDFNKRQKINEHDLTLMGNKISGLFAKRNGKLQITPFLTKKRLTLEKCIFRYDQNHWAKSSWLLYDATPYPYERENKNFLVYSCERVTEAASWLIINGLYDFQRTLIDMPPNSSGLNVNDLIDLLKHLQSIFSPAVQMVKIGENLQSDAKINQMIIIMDLSETLEDASFTQLDLVYSNTWGEIFMQTYPFQKGLQMISSKVANLDVINEQEALEKVKIHVPRSRWLKNAKKPIYHAILEGLQA